jgi:nitroimidazol reductase NimA-like FMN-containing flavoprotein (pyridoxamine 5'-phosphate oxidase superfamily)
MERGAGEAAAAPSVAKGEDHMPGPMTEQERTAFLAEPHVAVLSVASGGARPPATSPVWYCHQPDGNIAFFTNTQGRVAKKAALIRAAGVVSLCVHREAFPYKYVTVEGTVIGDDRPPAREQALAIVRRYLPEEAAQGFVAAELGRAESEFTLFTIRPDRWHTLDLSDAAR